MKEVLKTFTTRTTHLTSVAATRYGHNFNGGVLKNLPSYDQDCNFQTIDVSPHFLKNEYNESSGIKRKNSYCVIDV